MGDSEMTTLLGFQRKKREHVLGILEGLDEEALRRPVLPSGWNCLGLVHHLALDVEKFWFRAVVAGERAAIEEILASPDAWKPAPELTGAEVFGRYREECERADAVLAGVDLDAPTAWWPDFFSGWRYETVREVVVHVLTETATHAGHLDAVRELMDGRQRLVVG